MLGAKILRFIKEHGDACLHVAKHLSRDCSSAYEVIRSIGLNNSASEKLARFLVEWASDGRMNDGAIQGEAGFDARRNGAVDWVVARDG